MKKVAIMTHDGARQTMEEFAPYYDRLAADIVIYAPDRHKGDVNIGQSAHKGRACIDRFCDTVMHACKFMHPEEVLVVAEYDTLPIHAVAPVHSEDSFGSSLWKLEGGELCALSPWSAKRKVWHQVVSALRSLGGQYADWTLGGLLDRVIGHSLMKSGIPNEPIRNAIGYIEIPNPHRYIVAARIDWVHGWKSLAEFKPLI